MICEICGKYEAVGNLVVPTLWKKIRPSLDKSHAHMCDRCGMDAEFEHVPDALKAEAQEKAGHKKYPSYTQMRRRKYQPGDLQFKVEWISDRVIHFVDYYHQAAICIGNSWELTDISRYIDRTFAGERFGMSVSLDLAQELIVNYRAAWDCKSVFDLSPSKTVCPACHEIFTAEQADDYGRCEHCSFGKLREKTTEVVSNKLVKETNMSDPVVKKTVKTDSVIVQAVMMSASTLARKVADVKTTRDEAEIIAQAKILVDALKVLLEGFEIDILDCPGFYELFPELNRKVVLQEGKELSEINNAVLDDLLLSEIKQIVKVSEKGLTSIGKEALISKYKVKTGKGKASVQVRELSKEDLSKLHIKG